ncbi:hypothetical protein Droror1_Dr00006601 [Drosera rotundifolia]
MMLNTAAASPEMLHCPDMAANGAASAETAKTGGDEISVLERQRAVLKWQQDQLQLQFQQQNQHQQQCYFNELNMLSVPSQAQSLAGLMNMEGPCLGDMMILNRPLKQDPSLAENGWPDFGSRSGITTVDLDLSGAYGVNYTLSRTTSCLPAAATTMAMKEAVASVAAGDHKGGDSISADRLSALAAGRESFKKRKPDKSLPMPPKVDVEEDNRAKKLKACGDADRIEKPEIPQQNFSKNNTANNKNSNTSIDNNENKNRETSGCTSKENSKASEVRKPDYIHVRARRGQATDSHSLAERVRREKISERMKYLQDLVPGCNKITGKAGMLDEIINYVQSLQRQVEFLSMKLAAVNPGLDINIEDLFAKEVFPACSTAQLPTVGVTADMVNQSYLQYNQLQPPMDQPCSSAVGINPVDINLRRSISAPMVIPSAFPDLSVFNQIHGNPSTWEAELQNILAMQTYTGPINEARTLKMDM